MVDSSILTDNFKSTSVWLEGVARPQIDSTPLPGKADIVVVGSGYTGLAAALEMKRLGANPIIIDTGAAGCGTSTRNTGVLMPFPFSYRHFSSLFGETLTGELIKLYVDAYHQCINTIESQGYRCDLDRRGQLRPAHSRAALDDLEREYDMISMHLDTEVRFLDRDELEEEIPGQRLWVGARLNPRLQSLNGAKLHACLLRHAVEQDIPVHENTRVLDIEHATGSVLVRTTRGDVAADQALAATNAHTGKPFTDVSARLLCLTATLIATERLEPSEITRMLPQLRACVDTRKGFIAFRPSADGSRLVLGKAGSGGVFGSVSAAAIRRGYRVLLSVFPALRGVRLEYGWTARVAVTADNIPHFHSAGGVNYALGYNGWGIAMGMYLGTHAARRMLAADAEPLIFEEAGFSRVNKWLERPAFQPAMRTWLRFLDALH